MHQWEIILTKSPVFNMLMVKMSLHVVSLPAETLCWWQHCLELLETMSPGLIMLNLTFVELAPWMQRWYRVCLCIMVFVGLCPCSLLLDNERWKQAEVPAEFQDLVNSIADGRITLPERKIPGTQNPKPEYHRLKPLCFCCLSLRAENLQNLEQE